MLVVTDFLRHRCVDPIDITFAVADAALSSMIANICRIYISRAAGLSFGLPMNMILSCSPTMSTR